MEKKKFLRKIIRIGNSIGYTIPRGYAEKNDVCIGDHARITIEEIIKK